MNLNPLPVISYRTLVWQGDRAQQHAYMPIIGGKLMPCRRPRATLPSQYIWLASCFGACNEMPQMPVREHR